MDLAFGKMELFFQPSTPPCITIPLLPNPDAKSSRALWQNLIDILQAAGKDVAGALMRRLSKSEVKINHPVNKLVLELKVVKHQTPASKVWYRARCPLGHIERV